MPLQEHVVTPEEAQAAFERLRTAIQPTDKRKFVELLAAMLKATEKGIDACELSQDGKKVVIIYTTGNIRWVNVEGDNCFAIAHDVITELNNS